MLSHVPTYADSAKEKLLWIVNNAGADIIRWNALYGLEKNYKAGFIPELLQIASSNTSVNVRIWAFQDLFELGYSDIRPFITGRLSLETDWIIRLDIADSLLARFGSPSDYARVQEYALTEPNDTARSVINYSLEYFQPPVPSPSTRIPVLMDSLAAVKHEVYTLAIQNNSTLEARRVSVTFNNLPSWLEFKSNSVLLKSISANSSGDAEFTFSVDRKAPVGIDTTLTATISSADGQVWTKDITVSVGAPTDYKLYNNFPSENIVYNQTHMRCLRELEGYLSRRVERVREVIVKLVVRRCSNRYSYVLCPYLTIGTTYRCR